MLAIKKDGKVRLSQKTMILLLDLLVHYLEQPKVACWWLEGYLRIYWYVTYGGHALWSRKAESCIVFRECSRYIVCMAILGESRFTVLNLYIKPLPNFVTNTSILPNLTIVVIYELRYILVIPNHLRTSGKGASTTQLSNIATR